MPSNVPLSFIFGIETSGVQNIQTIEKEYDRIFMLDNSQQEF